MQVHFSLVSEYPVPHTADPPVGLISKPEVSRERPSNIALNKLRRQCQCSQKSSNNNDSTMP